MNIMSAEEMEASGQYEDYPSMMRAFAKAHVQAALQAAANNAEIDVEFGNPYDKDTAYSVVNKESILNSYPLKNIT